jgi:predicted nucleic acid-binding protein
MYSTADARKQARAQQLFAELGDANRILLSTQVIQEFFSAGVRKLTLPVQRRNQEELNCCSPRT